MDPWYLEHLVCPVDKSPLSYRGGALVSDNGRTYPVVDSVPVMLVKDAEQTIGVARASLELADGSDSGELADNELYLESLGISSAEKTALVQLAAKGGSRIDPVVAFMVGATNGNMYRQFIGKLDEYPIPELRVPKSSDGTPLLDLGCNWGRWSIAAARKGYSPVGIDPSLGAIMAARRVASQLKLPIRYVVGDARYLPFRDSEFGVVFSYSVLQHLSKPNVMRTLAEVARVLAPAGASMLQMPNWLGVRSFYHQARRKFREPTGFEVRYWSLRELKRAFGDALGPSSISVDCYFGLGLQTSDRHLMPFMNRLAIDTSERMRAISERVEVLKHVADSVYVHSVKRA